MWKVLHDFLYYSMGNFLSLFCTHIILNWILFFLQYTRPLLPDYLVYLCLGFAIEINALVCTRAQNLKRKVFAYNTLTVYFCTPVWDCLEYSSWDCSIWNTGNTGTSIWRTQYQSKLIVFQDCSFWEQAHRKNIPKSSL